MLLKTNDIVNFYNIDKIRDVLYEAIMLKYREFYNTFKSNENYVNYIFKEHYAFYMYLNTIINYIDNNDELNPNLIYKPYKILSFLDKLVDTYIKTAYLLLKVDNIYYKTGPPVFNIYLLNRINYKLENMTIYPNTYEFKNYQEFLNYTNINLDDWSYYNGIENNEFNINNFFDETYKLNSLKAKKPIILYRLYQLNNSNSFYTRLKILDKEIINKKIIYYNHDTRST